MIFSNKNYGLQKKDSLQKKQFYISRLCNNYWITCCTRILLLCVFMSILIANMKKYLQSGWDEYNNIGRIYTLFQYLYSLTK